MILSTLTNRNILLNNVPIFSANESKETTLLTLKACYLDLLGTHALYKQHLFLSDFFVHPLCARNCSNSI
jgi:hypothetical protein